MARPDGLLIDGKQQPSLTWQQWWEQKDIVNAALVEAISKQNVQQVGDLLDEKIQPHGLTADVNHRLDSD